MYVYTYIHSHPIGSTLLENSDHLKPFGSHWNWCQWSKLGWVRSTDSIRMQPRLQKEQMIMVLACHFAVSLGKRLNHWRLTSVETLRQ